MLLGLGKSRRLAVPLALVGRLVEVPAAAAERAGHQEVVQYRGRILPLVRLARLFPDTPPRPEPDAMRLVICGEPGRQVGLVVDQIVDVIEAAPEPQPSTRGDGTLGAAVLGQQVTDLLDVPGIIQAAYTAATART